MEIGGICGRERRMGEEPDLSRRRAGRFLQKIPGIRHQKHVGITTKKQVGLD